MTATLLAQDYQGVLHIVVVDDASTDDTAALARAAVTPGICHSLEVIAAPALVPGWTGKLWALNSGLRHFEAMTHDYIWFTDADIVHPPETLTRLVSKALNNKRDLVSLMVRLRCVSFWEHRLVPAFIFFFQMLYPFAAANDDRARTAAAAGGCVLLSRVALRNAGGLAVISGRVIDDCALASIIKRSGGRIWLGLADASHSLRRETTPWRLCGLWCAGRPSPPAVLFPGAPARHPLGLGAGFCRTALGRSDGPLASTHPCNPRGAGGVGVDGAELCPGDPQGLWEKPLGRLAITPQRGPVRRHDGRFGPGPLATPRRPVERPPLWAFIAAALSVRIPCGNKSLWDSPGRDKACRRATSSRPR